MLQSWFSSWLLSSHGQSVFAIPKPQIGIIDQMFSSVNLPFFDLSPLQFSHKTTTFRVLDFAGWRRKQEKRNSARSVHENSEYLISSGGKTKSTSDLLWMFFNHGEKTACKDNMNQNLRLIYISCSLSPTVEHLDWVGYRSRIFNTTNLGRDTRLKQPRFRSQTSLAASGRGWITCEGDSPPGIFR